MLPLDKPGIQPFIDDFAAAYTELGIGAYTREIAMDAILKGPTKIISAHTRKLNDQLDRDSVKSLKLRAMHINRHYIYVRNLNKAVEALTIHYKENNKR